MKTRHGKSGFTIVEMLMVLGIIAVLLGIVTSASMSAIRHFRERKAEAVRSSIETGISTYRVQNGEWPGVIKGWSEKGIGNGDHTRRLSDDEYDTIMNEMVKQSVASSGVKPLMDVSGIMVTRKGSNGSWALEFKEAIKREHKHGGTIKLANMVFGYLTNDGRFSRCHVTYNADTDHVTVSR